MLEEVSSLKILSRARVPTDTSHLAIQVSDDLQSSMQTVTIYHYTYYLLIVFTAFLIEFHIFLQLSPY